MKRTLPRMYITKVISGWCSLRIEAEGYPAQSYCFYSTRDAEREYRRQYGLTGKNFCKVITAPYRAMLG